MIKIEDLIDAELDALVAEKVMEWVRGKKYWYSCDNPGAIHGVGYTVPGHTDYDISSFSPSTDIACTFEVDKPEWEWRIDETGDWYGDGWHLRMGIWDDKEWLADITILIDPNNKVSAHCRGRCIAALKACGVTEI